ncbi:unnamed protein product [Didymodactylos carnosus]|uniref:UDP-glucuronate decarboxylase n=1 Tax=Didymodactylos carnosus TaxID=1234261 RepID=A0A815ITX9_9BILA|nr:unnamed protein product [Didymodactylos carnosus]CAF4254068.1 unnamed protein product [Didymodactylos carnosus]
MSSKLSASDDQSLATTYEKYYRNKIVSALLDMCHVRTMLYAYAKQIYGSEKQTRSFAYVSDLVDGLIKLMNRNYSSPMNIDNPDEYTIEQFALIIKDLVGANSTLVYKEACTDDPKQRRPDITLAKTILNWQPTVKLNEGLNKTIAYFRNELLVKRHSERNVYFPTE